MSYYNTLVAKKLKTISEIQRTHNLIDANKRAGEDVSDHLEKLELLKTELELLNARILTFHLDQGDLTVKNPDDPNISSSGLPE